MIDWLKAERPQWWTRYARGEDLAPEPPKMTVIVPKGARWDDSHNCLLYVNGEYIGSGTSRNLLTQMNALGLVVGGRYFVQLRQKGKEMELRVLTREQRAAGERAVIAIRNLNEDQHHESARSSNPVLD